MDALSIAAVSMRSDMERVAQAGHNLVNVSTPGYKRVLSSQDAQRFAGLHAAHQTLLLAQESSTPTFDTSRGAIAITGRTTDLAIEGDGFFVLESAEGPLLTRRGDFQIDGKGRLVGDSGMPVLGANGEIVVGSNAIRIDAAGKVFENDKLIDQLKVVTVKESSSLKFVGPGVFAASSGFDVSPDSYRILQGHLEGSNVNSANEMLKLVELVKHIEANQRVLQYQDEMLGKALGKFAEI